MENFIAKNVEYEAKSDESQWWFLKENIVMTETQVLSEWINKLRSEMLIAKPHTYFTLKL